MKYDSCNSWELVDNSGEKLLELLVGFQMYVEENNSRYLIEPSSKISFNEGFLEVKEGHKVASAINARKALDFRAWYKKAIGSGKILHLASKAIDQSDKLVHHLSISHFKNVLESNAEAEQALNMIFFSHDDESAFKKAMRVFGRKYDLLSFLFYVKNSERYLPIRPSRFDDSFKSLGLDYRTSYRCSWENYNGFISIIAEIQRIMNEILPLKEPARLIDAHSFVWMLPKVIKYMNSRNEVTQKRVKEEAEKILLESVKFGSHEPLKYDVTTSRFSRDERVVESAKKLANGVCQLCGENAPFHDKRGNPFLEVHHIVWLKRKGADKLDNAIALCPNCHSKMHVLDDRQDIDYLLSVARKNASD